MSKIYREKRDVIIAVVIAASLTFYNLSIHLLRPALANWETGNGIPVTGLLSNALFFWTLGLLWIAFRRWHAAARREGEFADILSSTGPELVMVIDAQRRILMCNDSITEIFGYDAKEVVNLKADVLYEPGTSDPRVPALAFEALKKAGFHRGEAIGRRKDGTLIQLEVITAPLKKRSGLVVLIQDITERKRNEELLRIAKQQAEQANRVNEELLAKLATSYQELKQLESLRNSLVHMVVHDMKTPLQVMQLHLHLIRPVLSSPETEEQEADLDTISGQIRHLELMIGSLLDVSRLQNGKMPVHCEPLPLGRAVEEAVSYIRPLAREHKLEVGGDHAASQVVEYDPDIIQRVLVNLLINAIKFSPTGEKITILLVEQGDSLRVTVADNGPGVPEEFREQIFEQFGQVTESSYRRKGSSGLGLTFCKMAVEAHGGCIGVESNEDRGSAFWFTLPCTAVPAPPADHPAEATPAATPATVAG